MHACPHAGTHSPALDNTAGPWQRLTDGQIRYVNPASNGGIGHGTRTTAGVSPFITMQLSASTDDIVGMHLGMGPGHVHRGRHWHAMLTCTGPAQCTPVVPCRAHLTAACRHGCLP